MKKVMAILATFVLAVAGLAACGNSDEVEVTIFQFKVENKEGLEKAATAYMANNPNVKITIETVGGGQDYGAALRSKFQSGAEPTIFNIGGPQDVEDWQAYLEDLSDQPWIPEVYDGLLGAVTSESKVYGMPFNQEGYGLIYNKTIFEKAGIDATTITDYASLEAAVKTLDSKKEELGIDGVFIVPGKETWSTGLHGTNTALSPEFGSATDAYNSKTVEFTYSEGLQAYMDLQRNYANKTGKDINVVDYKEQVESGFALGKAAMIQQGNWVYGDIEKIDPEVAKNVGFLPIPIKGTGKEDSIFVGVPMYWSVNTNKNDAEKAAAKDFLNWLYTSDEGKTIVVEDLQFIPAIKGYDKVPDNPLAQDIVAYSEAGKTQPWVFMGYPSGWGMENIGVELQKYFAGEQSWDDVIQHSKDAWAKARE
ncbi:ABC transporter substrate-binding protein [Culicoidibacter larvae]|uniref:Carbohydrate ABC transporter substrate-binding protein n=1 Tax=Culicoidibacter larvae TaxID=2579976 RepID=A0A5R8QEJ1_9FIRM|nr:ABC transporter substrate-binding protein [Culicoidibacter larvae]TLG75440.1 carbohydrate ABC transporter substrate-binding protein [Culicoidibacter larvae]